MVDYRKLIPEADSAPAWAEPFEKVGRGYLLLSALWFEGLRAARQLPAVLKFDKLYPSDGFSLSTASRSVEFALLSTSDTVRVSFHGFPLLEGPKPFEIRCARTDQLDQLRTRVEQAVELGARVILAG